MNPYKTEAEFDAFISGLRKKHKTWEAVIYDQYHSDEPIVRHVSGTRNEILAQYAFYKSAYPDRNLGLVSKAFYELLINPKK